MTELEFLQQADDFKRMLARTLWEAQQEWDRMNANGWSDMAKAGGTFYNFAAERLAATIAKPSSKQ